MSRFNKAFIAVGMGVLTSTLCLAQNIESRSPAVWNHGVLEVSVGGQVWAQAVPFTLMTQGSQCKARFGRSSVTMSQNMRPDGPVRTAQALFHKQPWLLWGEGKAPVSAEGSPYNLIAQPVANGGTHFEWVTPDLSQKIVATPDRVQKIKTKNATWCTWFSATGEFEQNPQIADGQAPSIRWMLWKRPAGAACR